MCIQYRWVALRDIEVTDIVLPDHSEEEVAHERSYGEIVQERIVAHNPLVLQSPVGEADEADTEC